MMKKKGSNYLKNVPISKTQKVSYVYIEQSTSLSFIVEYVPVEPKLTEEQPTEGFSLQGFWFKEQSERQTWNQNG